MKKILLLNGGKQFAHSDGRYNATLHNAAVAYLDRAGFDVKTTFIDGGYVGELIEATGQVTKAGKSLIFVRGQITTGERLLMTFSGVIRKFTPR